VMDRKENDFYETPGELVLALIDRVGLEGTKFECCSGDNAIARFFPNCLTNDIDPLMKAKIHFDVSKQETWDYLNKPLDWVVTNPPFNQAADIIPKAFSWANYGIAFLLRLTYLEPTGNRGEWLQEHTEYLSDIIVFNPRPKFRPGEKGTDSVTVAWFVWRKNHFGFGRTKVSFVTDWRTRLDTDPLNVQRQE